MTTVIAAFTVITTAVILFSAFYIRMAERGNEKKAERERRKNEEHRKNTADIIGKAEKIKNDANTGNHSNDMHVMAGQLHDYAGGGK